MGVGVARLGRYSVLLSDVDVVWLRDPSQFLAAPGLRAADVAVTSDCIFDFMRPDQQVDDPYGQRRSVLNAEFNTGVLLVRATQAGRDFATRCASPLKISTPPNPPRHSRGRGVRALSRL